MALQLQIRLCNSKKVSKNIRVIWGFGCYGTTNQPLGNILIQGNLVFHEKTIEEGLFEAQKHLNIHGKDLIRRLEKEMSFHLQALKSF